MRQNGHRTRVWRGPTRQRASDAIAHMLVPCPVFFFFLFPNTLRFVLTRAESVRIGWNRRNTPIQAVPAPNWLIQVEIQKKKEEEEKVQNAPFELNNKTLNYLSSQPDSFFNLQLSLTLCAP